MIKSPVKIQVDPKEYRKPLTVKEWKRLGNSTYPVCPRCNRTMDREYMRFCDLCGQRVAWRIPLVKKPR